ncbi:Cinnamoyl-CoA reductase [Vigna angularis]|uniref:Cinnamoyl-CoA reductase n=1 Tax=Phaseolus angularis TaxID=3914 RepID=A0A8T0KE12_PHAAN|nr:Cinnamoyl-CoA reductase [Vigna angularis]
MSSNIEKVVCVTGASGFIASWIVKFLLQRGYTVRATVRNPANHEKVDHLLKLDGAKERLHLYKADLLEEGSFDSAFEGCYGVFHTASRVQFVVNDPQKELIDPAVKGTLNVVKSYPNILRENERWYALSKTLAEDAARKFLDEQDIKLVVINPAMTIGPLLQQEMNGSSSSILKLINGSETFPNFSFGWVNVKDVADAHVQAYESDSASGRYCLVERVAHFSEIVKILGQMYPTLKIADKCEDDEPFMPTFQVSKEKAKSLGIEFISLEESLKVTVECLKEKKLVEL